MNDVQSVRSLVNETNIYVTYNGLLPFDVTSNLQIKNLLLSNTKLPHLQLDVYRYFDIFPNQERIQELSGFEVTFHRDYQQWVEYSMKPILVATSFGFIKTVKSLPKQKLYEVDENNFNALHYACKYGRMEITQYLSNYLNIDSIGYNQFTPFLVGVSSGHLNIIQFLYNKGANILHYNINGSNALHIASLNGNEHLLPFLLPFFDINDVNFNHRTALIIASIHDHWKVVSFLIRQKNINLNIQDKFGFTAFMYACKQGNVRMVQLLLKQKEIDIRLVDVNGNTARMFASPHIRELIDGE